MDVLSMSDERKKFERWLKRYWGGIKPVWLSDAEEYEGQVQIAWEAWDYQVRRSARSGEVK